MQRKRHQWSLNVLLRWLKEDILIDGLRTFDKISFLKGD